MKAEFFNKSLLNDKSAVVRRKALKERVKYAFAAALLLIICTFLYKVFIFYPVSLGDRWIQVRLGATVRDVVTREKISLERGDLKDTEGRLLKAEEGRAPGIFVNGSQVSLNKVLSRGDRITIRPGLDVVEQVERRIETVPPTTYVKGTGALLTIGSTGYPGMKIVNVGANSGRVITEEIIRPVKPVVLNREVHTQNQVVALTFDDGPSPTFTPQILSILQAEQVPATFFLIGSQAKKYPSLVAGVLGSGSAVGNHTYSHALLSEGSMPEVEAEIAQAEDAIKEACGVGSYWFRPPGGCMSASIVEAASIQGCKTVLWTIDPLDWMQPSPDQICQRVLNQVHPGAVILLHDGGGDRTGTVQALPKIIAELRAKGYSFVKLDEIAGK